MYESQFGVEGYGGVAVEREPVRVYVPVEPGLSSVEAGVVSRDDSLNDGIALEE